MHLRTWMAGICFMASFAAAAAERPPVILVSLDAFRWDYCDLYPKETVNLRAFRAKGVSARALIPVFPSNTFPNHYSIVTGLRPAKHGIVNNRFFDSATGKFFIYNLPQSVRQSEWWGGEPIWVTAAKQGRRSACSFWVGSEAEIAGHRPTFWKPFDPRLPFEERLAEAVEWLNLPVAQRPAVITFYLEDTNRAGHDYGPSAPETAAAIQLLDQRVGQMVAAVEKIGVAANFLVVSDHGMTALEPGNPILLDDYLDLSLVQIDFDGPVVGLRPVEGSVETVLAALATLPHARVVRREDLPAEFHMGATPRLPPLWILPERGWSIMRRNPATIERDRRTKGEHGYAPTERDMQGIAVAWGPDFKQGEPVFDPVESIHVYELLCALVGLRAAPNDGDDRLVKAWLRSSN